MNSFKPVSENELERLITLSEFDVDYLHVEDNFKDLAKLAAKVANTGISLVNLVDTSVTWTIAGENVGANHMPRNESICEYTILEESTFEVKNLAADPRFKDKFYVKGEPFLRYYFGVILKADDGHNIGSLCLMDKVEHTLDPEKVELLKIIASEIVNRIKILKVVEDLKSKVTDAIDTKIKVVHDIRGPLSGIIGIAKVISEQGDKNNLRDVLQFIKMIHKSGTSILELANEILSNDKSPENVPVPLQVNELNLVRFKEKLENLYLPQAKSKDIHFSVITTTPASKNIPFLRNKLLQIAGNLISNAIKFTPPNGDIVVNLTLKVDGNDKALHIAVKDSSVGINEEMIEKIINGKMSSTEGTVGEKGFGFGLSLVKHLVESLKGTMQIQSVPGKETIFNVLIPDV